MLLLTLLLEVFFVDAFDADVVLLKPASILPVINF
jgi:hypothetical protein